MDSRLGCVHQRLRLFLSMSYSQSWGTTYCREAGRSSTVPRKCRDCQLGYPKLWLGLSSLTSNRLVFSDNPFA